MKAAHVSADNPAETSAAAPAVRAPAPPSWAWRRAALILAIAAQLITVSALVGANPPPVTWSSLLLAIAPALLAAPYERFTIRSTADATTFVLLLIVGVAVSQLAAYARRLKVIAITDEGYLAQIQQATALAQTAESPQVTVDYVQEQLPGLLGLERVRFELGSLLSHPPRLEPDGSLSAGQGRWDVEKAGLPAEFELWVTAGGQYYGRFLLTPLPGSRPPLQARLVAVSLAGLVGRAFSAAETTRSTR